MLCTTDANSRDNVITDASPVLQKQISRNLGDQCEQQPDEQGGQQGWVSPRSKRAQSSEPKSPAAPAMVDAAPSPNDSSPLMQKQLARLASGDSQDWESPRTRREKERAKMQSVPAAIVDTNPLLLRQMQRNASTDQVNSSE
jgi:hypothetical protein